jgi:hypothetical protein
MEREATDIRRVDAIPTGAALRPEEHIEGVERVAQLSTSLSVASPRGWAYSRSAPPTRAGPFQRTVAQDP